MAARFCHLSVLLMALLLWATYVTADDTESALAGARSTTSTTGRVTSAGAQAVSLSSCLSAASGSQTRCFKAVISVNDLTDTPGYVRESKCRCSGISRTASCSSDYDPGKYDLAAFSSSWAASSCDALVTGTLAGDSQSSTSTRIASTSSSSSIQTAASSTSAGQAYKSTYWRGPETTTGMIAGSLVAVSVALLAVLL